MNTSEQQTDELKPGTVKIRTIEPEDQQKKPLEKSIFFEFKSEVDGKLYAGNFTFKKLTLGGISKVAILRTRRNGGYASEQIDEATATVNNAIAHIQVWFEDNKSLPEWAQNWDNLVDVMIPLKLFEEGSSFETSFRKPVGT